MADVPFSALYEHVLPYLPAAEPPLVDSQIRKVAREFMKRTTLVREAFAFDTEAGTATYKLLPASGMVSSVLQVTTDTYPDGLPAVPEGSRIPSAAPGEPRGWHTAIPHLLTLYPVPDAAYALRVTGVITLDHDAVALPEELVDHHAESLAAGVLAAMYGMPGKPWTQSQAAKDAGRLYAGAIRTIRGQLRDGGQPNQSTFRGRARFGA